MDWIQVNRRKTRNKIKHQFPHVVTRERAQRLQGRLNIDKLYDALMSEEWIQYQCDGWKYIKVIRDGAEYDKKDEKEYSVLPIGNEWNDHVLFVKMEGVLDETRLFGSEPGKQEGN